jgi:BirA family biotin operon repressor/biotin-[acetyl-CoA-carboxylase] ligase
MLDSTNAELKRQLVSEKVLEGTLITCNLQEQGRGYAGNTWKSEKDKNIMMSLLLQPTFLNARFQFYLNQVVALGIFDALNELLKSNKLKIKWPNDLMFKDKKLCGILIENIIQGNTIQHSVVGTGLNVNETGWSKKGLPQAISLKQILKSETNIMELVYKICSSIEARYLMLKANKMQLLQEDYMKNLYRVEERHIYTIKGIKSKAKIVGLNPEGKLILQTKHGFEVCDFKEVVFSA